MPPDELIRCLHAALAAPCETVSDAELLARCAAGDDDTAFELLMRRHADMVWRVCRALAGDHHAAEDAFQAVFLVVAHKAGSFRGHGAAAGWIHRIAYHTALKARARQSATPRPAVIDLDTVAAPDRRDELARLLHEELGLLAEKYRTPLVLCYLEGYTHAEAAARLGWPI